MSHAMKNGNNTPLNRSISIKIPMMMTQPMEPRMKLSNVIFFLSIYNIGIKVVGVYLLLSSSRACR